jgi:FtsP/CotA-like multicopper oxidase with cupredoxin domain
VNLGERVLFHILNGSATEIRSLALPGHTFEVVSMDGNTVITAKRVPVLWIGTAERISAIVEMNHPGVWIMGDTADDDRNHGMGIVVEYAHRAGKPIWLPPPHGKWNYTWFASANPAQDPDETFDIHPIHLHRHVFELAKVAGQQTSGIMKDIVMVGGYQSVEIDFVANNPGLTLFHCHQQLHMDFGFMTLFDYV